MDYNVGNIKNAGQSQYTDIKNITHNVNHFVMNNADDLNNSRNKIIDEVFNVFIQKDKTKIKHTRNLNNIRKI